MPSFDVAEKVTPAYFGIDADTLSALCRAGLPYVYGPEGRQFSFADLHFLALRSGRASAYSRGITAWAHTLAALAKASDPAVEVMLLPQSTIDEAVIVLPDRTITRSVVANVPAAVIEVSPREPSARLPKAMRDVVNEVGAYDFYVLPANSSDRPGVARRIRAGDCASVAHVLRQDLETIGCECRTRYGLLVSVPYSTTHIWVEARVDHQWVAFDPLMLSVMKRFGGLDEGAWPAYRPLNIALIGVANVLPGEAVEIISSDRSAIATSFATSVHSHANS